MGLFTSIGLAVGASAASAAATGAAVVSTGVSLIGAGVSAYGQYQQGKTAESVAEYNAKVAENNAVREEMESREQLRRDRIKNRRMLSSQRVKIAGAGVIEEGTPLEVMAETAGVLEMNALDARRASRERSKDLRSGAAIERFSGAQAKIAGMRGAGASLLQGVAQAAGSVSKISGGSKTYKLAGGGKGTVIPGANYSKYTPGG